ncbi:MAG: DUF6525 family protein [Pseudomonadota bacterium]
MPGNLGHTSLKRRRRSGDPMHDFDRLRPELRAWLTEASLPWRPQSVRRAFDRALARTKELRRALEELDRLEARQIAKDAGKVWGPHYPQAHGPSDR